MSVCIICSLLQYLGVLETIERFGMTTLEVICMFQSGEDVIKFCIGILIGINSKAFEMVKYLHV